MINERFPNKAYPPDAGIDFGEDKMCPFISKDTAILNMKKGGGM